ncbi:PAS domain-containing protein [Ruegeria sp. R14_0]|uniref:PAS domain-containing protein n=1 Tax=Ruegeria sp. R14_0 TaxID=2821100 RepID=UPI001ADB37B5|nr:PAS domain-containing protein [Ruegeria sp. R14_0]MBO9445058.1 PAS domain-containing protein [Ruegeria sp. R14_0]
MKTIFVNGFGSSFGKIVAMDRLDSGRSLSPIRQAEAYWTALLTGDRVPMRSQIDPRGLENILEYTFVLERIAPGLTRFRLAGSHLNKLAGMEVRGMPLTAFFEASARDRVKEISEQVFAQPAIAHLNLTSAGRMGRVQLQARMILLPLRSDLGDVSRILGVMVSDGAIGATPRRFALSEDNLRPVSEVQTPQSQPQILETGFAEEQERFERPRSHLRLVVSRDD